MGTNESYARLTSELLSTRKLMKGLSSRDHWLEINEKVRGVLIDCFQELSDEQTAGIIGFSKETVQEWSQQYKTVIELKRRINNCKKPNSKNNTAIVRPDVCALARLVSPSIVAKELGLIRSSVYRWVAEKWDKVDNPDPIISQSQTQASETPTVETAAPSIGASDETKQLEQYLLRHKGTVRRKYSLSEKKLILELANHFGSKAVHEHFKISYDTIARLKCRESNELERKAKVPMRYIPVLDIMQKHPGMGPMQIRDYIRRHLGLSMEVNSIRKIMEQNGWVPPFVKSTRVTDEIKFYEAARKNYLWHMDFKHQYINKTKIFVLFVQDDYSRFIVGHSVGDGEKIEVVLKAVEESIRIHGKTECIMTDGGSAFFSWRGCSQFTRFLEDYGIEQLIAQTPNVNGKLENLNCQFEKEVLQITNFASLDHFNRELNQWVGFYNFSRVHQGLGHNQVPADRFFPGANQWYAQTTEQVRQQSLIAETMTTLLNELKKSK